MQDGKLPGNGVGVKVERLALPELDGLDGVEVWTACTWCGNAVDVRDLDHFFTRGTELVDGAQPLCPECADVFNRNRRAFGRRVLARSERMRDFAQALVDESDGS